MTLRVSPAVEASLQFEPAACDRAFERLYRRYARDVYRYTLAVLRNPHEAEDVTQTTFMNAYRAMKRGEEPLKPKHWLIKIAHNVCRTRHLRAARRPEEVPFDETQLELPVPESDALLVAEVLDALGKLPFNQRSALVMRELEGRSYAEIAETLGMSVAAVEALLYRARRGMRMRTSAVRALGVVQLPTSLSSFSTGAAAGGLIIGSSLVVKAAIAIAAGLLVGGVGYKTVEATVLNHDSRGLTRLDRPARSALFTAHAGSRATGGSAVPGAASDLRRSGDTAERPGRAGPGVPRATSLPDYTGESRRGGVPERPAAGSAAPTQSGSQDGSPTGTTTQTVKKTLEPLPSVSGPQAPSVPDPQLPPTPSVTTPVAAPPVPTVPTLPPPPPLPELPPPPPPPPLP